MITAEDIEIFKTEFKAKVDAMSQDERKQLVAQICGGVDKMATAVVENADALWRARPAQ